MGPKKVRAASVSDVEDSDPETGLSAKERKSALKEAEGRRKHLSEILLVFRHRGATWGDFGRFLKALLFEDADPTNPSKVCVKSEVPIRCRHSRGGDHAGLLDFGSSDPASRPCLSKGGVDNGKASGVVVHAVKKSALTYLIAMGMRARVTDKKRQPDQALSNAEEEGDGEADLAGPSGAGSKRPADPNTTGQPPLKRKDVPVRGKQTTLDGFIPNLRGGTGTSQDLVIEDFSEGDEDFDEDEWERWMADLEREVEEEEIIPSRIIWGGMISRRASELASQEAGPSAAASANSSFIGPLTECHDSQRSEASGPRDTSTKIRWHLLGYLARYADDPAELKERTLFLMDLNNKYQWILHLCGCGLSRSGDKDHESASCCEPSHLKIGSPSENRDHRTYHDTMRITDPSDYPTLVRIVRRGRNGADLF